MTPPSDPRKGSIAGPATTILIVLVIVIPILLFALLCYVRRTQSPMLARVFRHQPVQATSSTTGRRSKLPPRGVGNIALQSMPVFKYDPDAKPESHDKDGRKLGIFCVLLSAFRFKKGKANKADDPEQQQIPVPATELHDKGPVKDACAICTEDFRQRIPVRRLPCGHIFHPNCIDRWLANFAATCPLW